MPGISKTHPIQQPRVALATYLRVITQPLQIGEAVETAGKGWHWRDCRPMSELPPAKPVALERESFCGPS